MNNLSKYNNTKKNEFIFIEMIENKNIISDLTLNIILFIGSLGFLIVGISSFYKSNLLPLLNANEIIFFPQGATMSFYGTLGLMLSIWQLLMLYWKIGEGYNEFDKKSRTVTIFRKGFPGKNAEIKLVSSLEDIEAIKIKANVDVFNSRQTIFLCIRGKPDLPIIQINPPIQVSELEEKASELASFLQIPVKGS